MSRGKTTRGKPLDRSKPTAGQLRQLAAACLPAAVSALAHENRRPREGSAYWAQAGSLAVEMAVGIWSKANQVLPLFDTPAPALAHPPGGGDVQ